MITRFSAAGLLAVTKPMRCQGPARRWWIMRRRRDRMLLAEWSW